MTASHLRLGRVLPTRAETCKIQSSFQGQVLRISYDLEHICADVRKIRLGAGWCLIHWGTVNVVLGRIRRSRRQSGPGAP